jgi:hypothetical protein
VLDGLLIEVLTPMLLLLLLLLGPTIVRTMFCGGQQTASARASAARPATPLTASAATTANAAPTAAGELILHVACPSCPACNTQLQQCQRSATATKFSRLLATTLITAVCCPSHAVDLPLLLCRCCCPQQEEHHLLRWQIDDA